MPIYEYQCEACGRQTEVLQKISEPALTDCPACGKPSLRKLVSRAGFQLKGTGWYVTDFRDQAKQAKPGAKGESKDAPAEAAKGAAEGGSGESTKAAEPAAKAASSTDAPTPSKAKAD